MKKRTILGLCLSIFSLILFSCGIADNNKGNASFTLDTAKIAQRSVQSANFSEVSDEEIFLKYAEYVYFDLSAIVHYEIDGEATDQTFDLWSMNGKEAYELVEKLKNMSGEDEEAYFVEKFSSQTLTITDLPIGKDATFRLKIHQKVGFNIDLSEYGLSESETTKEEYLAISKKPVTARIGEDTDIKIVIGEYDSSLDWEENSSTTEKEDTEKETDGEDEITGLPWTFTANISENDKDSFNMEFGLIYFFNKTNGNWNLLSSAAITVDDNALTIAREGKIKGSGVVSSAIEGSGIASCLSAGDTVLMTMMIFTQPANEYGGYENKNLFVGWSDEITIGEDTNKFEFGELSYKEEFHTPLPEAKVYAQLESDKDIISTAYAKIDISKVDETGATTGILTQGFQFTPKEVTGSSYYNGIYYFDSSAFSGLEDGEKISVNLTLYSDASMSESLCTYGTEATFLKKTENIFWFSYFSGDSGEGDTTSSGESDTTSSGEGDTIGG